MANVPSETQLLSIKLMVCTKFPYNNQIFFTSIKAWLGMTK